MAKKTVTYKEPASYFNEGMRKVAEEWEKKHGKQGSNPKGSGAKKPATKKK